MTSKITSNGLDKWLDDHINGFSVTQRRKVNKAGSDIYEGSMQRFLNEHKTPRVYKNKQHLADTLTHEISNDGHYEVGFSKKGKKAYIARLLNDGWDVKNQYGGPYTHAQPPEWHDFFSKIGDEKDQAMAKAMVNEAKRQMRSKQ